MRTSGAGGVTAGDQLALGGVLRHHAPLEHTDFGAAGGLPHAWTN